MQNAAGHKARRVFFTEPARYVKYSLGSAPEHAPGIQLREMETGS
jgi:hypothetical protein